MSEGSNITTPPNSGIETGVITPGEFLHLPFYRQKISAQQRPQEVTAAASLEGASFVGSPQQVIDKLFYQYVLFGQQRFMARIDIGGLPYKKVTRPIERLAAEVAPVIRQATGGQAGGASNV